MTKYLLVLVLVFCLGIGSCSKKEDKAINCATWATEIQDEITALTTTLIAYSTSATPANCTAYKNASQAYLNALKTFADCVATWSPDVKTSYQESLTETQAEINSLNCN